MADDNRSSREIEREIEQERAELRGSIDQLLGRLTFQDAWERTGAYLRDNRSEYGHTLGRMIKEKPFALALTAVGISWLLLGPATPASRSRGDTRVRRLSDADRDRPSAPPLPPSRAETAAGAPRWPPEHRPSSGAGTQAASRNSSGAGSGVDVASPSRSTPDAVGPAKTSGSTSAGDFTTGSPSPGNLGAATSRSTVSTSAAGNQNQTAKERPLGTPSAAPTSSEEDSRGEVRSPSASISTSAKSTPEPKSHSASETFDQDKGRTPKSLP